MGVAVVLLAPFGVRLALDAVEGVGYLDEPTVAPDGVHVAAIVRGGLWAPPALRIWNSLTGGTEAEYRYGTEEPAAAALAWSPDSRSVAVGADDGGLTLRAADTLAAMRSLAGYRGSFRATGMGWSPDGTRLAAVDGTGTLQVWRAEDGALVGATPVFTTYTGRVAWSPRSDAVAVHCDDASELAVVEVSGAGAGPVRRLAGPGPASSIAWAPDGTVLAAGFAASPHLVLFRRAGEGFTPQTVDRQDAHTGALAWSPDGTAIATTSTARPGTASCASSTAAPVPRSAASPGTRRCSRTRCGRRAATASRSPTAPGSSRGPCTARPRAGGRARSSPTVPASSPGPPTAACSRPVAATTPYGCGAPDARSRSPSGRSPPGRCCCAGTRRPNDEPVLQPVVPELDRVARHPHETDAHTTPGGPMNKTLAASSRNRSDARSRINASSTPGWAV